MAASRPRTLLRRLGVTLIVMQAATAAGLAWYIVAKIDDFNAGQASEELQQLAPLVAEQLTPVLDDPAALESAVNALAAGGRLRVTVVRPDGMVIADSLHDPGTMGDHRFRPEIDTALSEGSGSSVRFSATVGTDMMYVARRVGGSGEAVAVVRTALPISAVEARAVPIVRVLLIAVGCSLALTLLAIFIVSRYFSRAVVRLAEAADRLAAGEFDHDVQPSGVRELDAIASALNSTAERLATTMTQLRRRESEQRAMLESMGSGVIALDRSQCVISMNRSALRMLGAERSDVRGRLLQDFVRDGRVNTFVERAMTQPGAHGREFEDLAIGTTERAVHIAAEPLRDEEGALDGVLLVIDDLTDLRRLERMRSDFAANVSHELRTPITTIQGYVETLQDMGDADEEQRRRFLGIIRRNTGRLSAIIEELLSLASLEAADAAERLQTDRIAARDLVDEVVAAHLDEARERSVTIRPGACSAATIEGNRHLLEQALSNLVQNGVRYGGAGANVTVSAHMEEDAKTVVFTVEDTGPGIAAEHLPRIFERFYRVDRARSRAEGGTGLGLALVKHIALIHGGTVDVQSTPGAGSVFAVTLPIV